MVIFPVAPDQTIAQMWLSGARGGGGMHTADAVWIHHVCTNET